MTQLEKLKVNELIQICKEKNIELEKRIKKKEIINKILESEGKSFEIKLSDSTSPSVTEEVNQTTNKTEEVNQTTNKTEEVNKTTNEIEEVNKTTNETEEVNKTTNETEEVNKILEVNDDTKVNDNDTGTLIEENNKEILLEVNKQINLLENRYENIIKLINDLNKRIEGLEINQKQSDKKIFLDKSSNDVEKRLKNIEKNTNEENIILDKIDGNFDILKNKTHSSQTEIVDTVNSLYKIGLRFESIIDVNCFDTTFIDYIQDRGFDSGAVSLINEFNKCNLTNLELTDIEDNKYNLVLCFNLFQYLTDNDIKTYYKNLLRISNNYIVIKIDINKTNETIEHYMELFNDIVKEQKDFTIQRFITKNLPKSLFILKKEDLINN